MRIWRKRIKFIHDFFMGRYISLRLPYDCHWTEAPRLFTLVWPTLTSQHPHHHPHFFYSLVIPVDYILIQSGHKNCNCKQYCFECKTVCQCWKMREGVKAERERQNRKICINTKISIKFYYIFILFLNLMFFIFIYSLLSLKKSLNFC